MNLPNFDFYNIRDYATSLAVHDTFCYIEDIEVFGKMDGKFSWKIETNENESIAKGGNETIEVAVRV